MAVHNNNNFLLSIRHLLCFWARNIEKAEINDKRQNDEKQLGACLQLLLLSDNHVETRENKQSFLSLGSGGSAQLIVVVLMHFDCRTLIIYWCLNKLSSVRDLYREQLLLFLLIKTFIPSSSMILFRYNNNSHSSYYLFVFSWDYNYYYYHEHRERENKNSLIRIKSHDLMNAQLL